MPSDRRLITLTGTADFQIIVGDISNYIETVRQAFVNAGWDIVDVHMNKRILYTNAVNITIAANVVYEFTAEQARLVAIQVLESIPGQSYIYGTGLFVNVNLSVLREGDPPNAEHDSTLDTTLSSITQAVNDLAKEGVKGLTGNIGLPIAIGVGVIAILFMYGPRRR